jgi:hypothetical protein
VSSSGLPFVLRAANDDARAVAQLLHDFNREFDEPTPAVGELTERISRLLDGGDTVLLRRRRPICRTKVVASDRACTRLPPQNLHGKEGVDGSSPSEGSKIPAKRGFVLPELI